MTTVESMKTPGRFGRFERDILDPMSHWPIGSQLSGVARVAGAVPLGIANIVCTAIGGLWSIIPYARGENSRKFAYESAGAVALAGKRIFVAVEEILRFSSIRDGHTIGRLNARVGALEAQLMPTAVPSAAIDSEKDKELAALRAEIDRLKSQDSVRDAARLKDENAALQTRLETAYRETDDYKRLCKSKDESLAITSGIAVDMVEKAVSKASSSPVAVVVEEVK